MSLKRGVTWSFWCLQVVATSFVINTLSITTSWQPVPLQCSGWMRVSGHGAVCEEQVPVQLSVSPSADHSRAWVCSQLDVGYNIESAQSHVRRQPSLGMSMMSLWAVPWGTNCLNSMSWSGFCRLLCLQIKSLCVLRVLESCRCLACWLGAEARLCMQFPQRVVA